MLYRIFIFCALSWLPIISVCQDQNADFGSIQGHVLDEHDKPVPFADVTVQSTDKGTSEILPSVTSNAEGEFFIRRVPVGKTFVFASKTADGYPDTMIGPFSQGVNVIPEVFVQQDKTTSGVIVHLSKGAVLSGLIANENRQPILGARISISRDDNPRLLLSTRADTKGKFQFTIPSKPFNLQISEPGYTTWENGELSPRPKGSPILIDPGTHRELLIVLQKLPERSSP